MLYHDPEGVKCSDFLQQLWDCCLISMESIPQISSVGLVWSNDPESYAG